MQKGENFNHPSRGTAIRVAPIKSAKSIEAIKVLLADHPRNLALFTLGTSTGLRPGELLNIRVGDVKDLTPMDTLEVKEARTERVRSITLNQACIDSIQRLIRSAGENEGGESDPADPLFKVRKGRLSIPYLNNLVKKWCAEIGLQKNHGGHTLRKTYGYQRLIHDGADLNEIMESFNHPTPQKTLEYLCVTPVEYQRIINAHTQNRRPGVDGTVMQRLKMFEFENTKLKQRVEELREKDARLRTILASANDQIIYADLNGTILETNKKGAELFGQPDERIEGRRFQDLKNIAQEDMQWFVRKFEVAKTNTISPFKEFRLTRYDGSTAVAESSTNPVEKDGKITGFVSIIRDISDRKIAEEELIRYRNHLEELVKERTDELTRINKALKQENTSRRKAEKALLKVHKELEQKVKDRTANLEEANAALRVLLKKRDEDKNEFEDRMTANVKELVLPFLDKLKNSRLKDTQKAFAEIIEYNLRDIVSPFARELTSKYLNLTPAEIKISNLIKQGKSTKEVADILYMSTRTIDTHRFNIRKKLGLNNKKANLQTHLLSLE